MDVYMEDAENTLTKNNRKYLENLRSMNWASQKLPGSPGISYRDYKQGYKQELLKLLTKTNDVPNLLSNRSSKDTKKKLEKIYNRGLEIYKNSFRKDDKRINTDLAAMAENWNKLNTEKKKFDAIYSNMNDSEKERAGDIIDIFQRAEAYLNPAKNTTFTDLQETQLKTQLLWTELENFVKKSEDKQAQTWTENFPTGNQRPIVRIFELPLDPSVGASNMIPASSNAPFAVYKFKDNIF